MKDSTFLGERCGDLRLLTVGTDQLQQYDQLLRYVYQVTNAELQDSGYLEGELVRDKLPVLERSDAIGWFDGEDLVSELSVYPCQVNIHGRLFDMGGLTGVGTYPEYSNKGLMSRLINVALQRMRERGQWISYLYPYSVPYYKRKGWEIISERRAYTVRDDQLPHFRHNRGYVQRLPVGAAQVYDLYAAFARQRHGAMIRGQFEWEEYWRWENEDERIAAIYYTADHRPSGLLFYWVSEDVFHIKELIYLDNEAREGLWNFIEAHKSMIDKVEGASYSGESQSFFLEDSQISEQVEPYFMARIVDAAQFLRHYPFAEQGEDLHFVLTDGQAEWNNGCFGLHWPTNAEAVVDNQARGLEVRLDIRALTVMLMGYFRAQELADLERIQASPEAVRLLERIIPKQMPYFSDYF